MAIVSVTQNTPSNSTPRAASPRTAAAPASMLNTSRFTTRSEENGIFAARSA